MSPAPSATASPTVESLTEGELRTARLLFDRELAEDRLRLDAVGLAEVKLAAQVRAAPAAPSRMIQRSLVKLRLLDCWRRAERISLAARAAALGGLAHAPPRFLVRVDEFPHYRAWGRSPACGTASFERFHEAILASGTPYLVAALPRLARDPFDPRATERRALDGGEVAMLERMRDDGTAIALHGRDHRTRFRSARRRSELCGLDLDATDALIEDGRSVLAGIGIEPAVFVAPYNRFDASQLPLLARHFEVVCGGPESIGLLGCQNTPQWRGETVYLPSYPPFYGTAEQMLPAVRDAIARRTGLWTPIVLHWEWEARDGWRELQRLLEVIAPFTERWQDFVAAVRRSRAPRR
ncbi:MAG: DUF2334 domain-containing protein [Solirubrobacteraceae bacterium]